MTNAQQPWGRYVLLLLLGLVAGWGSTTAYWESLYDAESETATQARVQVTQCRSQVAKLTDENAKLQYEAQINAWPKLFECQEANRQLTEWAQQHQGTPMTPQDMETLLRILKLLL